MAKQRGSGWIAVILGVALAGCSSGPSTPPASGMQEVCDELRRADAISISVIGYPTPDNRRIEHFDFVMSDRNDIEWLANRLTTDEPVAELVGKISGHPALVLRMEPPSQRVDAITIVLDRAVVSTRGKAFMATLKDKNLVDEVVRKR